MRPFVIVGMVLAAIFVLVPAGMMLGMGMMGHGPMMGRGSDPLDEPAVTGVTEVDIENFAFEPANLRVPAGTTVSWTNRDGVAHTVTSEDGGPLDSELFGEGETYSHTFSQPGSYEYYCKPHPYMKGLVTVE
jgi:amicyanin